MNFYEVQVSVSEELERFGGAQRMLHWRDEAAFFQVGMRQKEYTFGGVSDLRMRAEIADAQ
jgi:lipopolysaccharide transport system ATP-binding protein